MPIHLRADPGDYAAAVLCPGDPRRAAYIAATFFEPGYRQVNEERGMLGFTGTFEGRPISVQSTGMGCPSAGIVFEELIQLGARRLIRVGTCGGLSGIGLRLADTVIALSATCEDTTPLRYADCPGWAAAATFGLVETAVRLGRVGRDRPRRSRRDEQHLLRPGRHEHPALVAARTPRPRDGGRDALHGPRRPPGRGPG